MGYFEIESIDNLYEIVVAINPEEYHEHFEDFRCNKKNKAKKKSSPGINFENFAKRILSVNEIENFENPKSTKIPRTAKIFSSRWWDPKNLQTNDKRFYLPNGITSVHKGHPSLSKLKWYNEKKREKNQKKIFNE